MKIKTLRLGIQTTPDNIEKAIYNLVQAWKPKPAKSYTCFDYINTDYHGYEIDTITGYANFKVSYFNTIKEGRLLC